MLVCGVSKCHPYLCGEAKVGAKGSAAARAVADRGSRLISRGYGDAVPQAFADAAACGVDHFFLGADDTNLYIVNMKNL